MIAKIKEMDNPEVLPQLEGEEAITIDIDMEEVTTADSTTLHLELNNLYEDKI